MPDIHHFVVEQAGLTLKIHLPLPPESWDLKAALAYCLKVLYTRLAPTCGIVRGDLEFLILLPLPPNPKDYKCATMPGSLSPVLKFLF